MNHTLTSLRERLTPLVTAIAVTALAAAAVAYQVAVIGVEGGTFFTHAAPILFLMTFATLRAGTPWYVTATGVTVFAAGVGFYVWVGGIIDTPAISAALAVGAVGVYTAAAWVATRDRSPGPASKAAALFTAGGVATIAALPLFFILGVPTMVLWYVTGFAITVTSGTTRRRMLIGAIAALLGAFGADLVFGWASSLPDGEILSTLGDGLALGVGLGCGMVSVADTTNTDR